VQIQVDQREIKENRQYRVGAKIEVGVLAGIQTVVAKKLITPDADHQGEQHV
jgi:hypothetical protein